MSTEHQTPPANVDQRAPALAPVPLLGSVFDRSSNFYPTHRTDLPENTRELLLTLHFEFYGGPKADADVFRILPRVINALENAGAIPPLPNRVVSTNSVCSLTPDPPRKDIRL